MPMEEDGVTPVYKPVWQFMMAGPTVEPDLKLDRQDADTFELSYMTCTDVIYRAETTANLMSAWSNVTSSLPGNDLTNTIIVNGADARNFYRLRMSY